MIRLESVSGRKRRMTPVERSRFIDLGSLAREQRKGGEGLLGLFGGDDAEADDEFDAVGDGHIEMSDFGFREQQEKAGGWNGRGRHENGDQFVAVG